ncbi:MAG: ABC transporter permease [Phycisphaerae bacterium]|nr:ABC transporter permease [Phycisphaerae bacterium]
MLNYILRRLLHMIPTLIVISVLVFVIIQLPPGDFVDSLEAELQESDSVASKEAMEQLREQYGLDKPMWEQYFKWISGFVVGDFGYSFEWRRPVVELIGERLALTFALSFGSLVFIYLIAIPIGIYSARHQNSMGDYAFSSFAVLGLCIPNFVLALVAMFVVVFLLGGSAGGLFSPEYRFEPWSFGKFLNMLSHLWVPIIVVGAAGMAGSMRVMRNSMLNVLREQYITTARAKGVSEFKVVYKYALRVAANPFITGLGMQLPRLISGSVIVAIVLGLPTTGPMFLKSLQGQDMYLAGSFLMFLAILLLLGNLLSDILLAISDPRIRLE